MSENITPFQLINYQQFEQVEVRAGTIIKAEIFERAKKPAYKVWVDFGPEFGVRQTSAQITVHYTPEQLIGKKVAGCLNLGEKNIAGFLSQFLLLGFPDADGAIYLIILAPQVPDGAKMG